MAHLFNAERALTIKGKHSQTTSLCVCMGMKYIQQNVTVCTEFLFLFLFVSYGIDIVHERIELKKSTSAEANHFI